MGPGAGMVVGAMSEPWSRQLESTPMSGVHFSRTDIFGELSKTSSKSLAVAS